MKDRRETELHIQKALNGVDPAFIEESAPSTDDDAEKHIKKGRTLWIAFAAAAAVLLLAVGTVATVLHFREKPPSGSDVPLPGKTMEMSVEASAPPADSGSLESKETGAPGQTDVRTEPAAESEPMAEPTEEQTETPAETEPMESEVTETPTVFDNTVYSYFTVDWPEYKDAGELVKAATNVYRGKVVGIAFEALNLKTGLSDVKGEDNDVMLHTVYTIEVAGTLKGEEKGYRYIKAIGGMEGVYVNEQVETLENAGALDPDTGITVCKNVDKLTLGDTYLFVTKDGKTEYELILDGNRFAFQEDGASEIASLFSEGTTEE